MSLNYGNSSTGRVAVSKTAGCGFDPCFPCKQRNMDKIISYIKDSYDELMHKVEWPDRVSLMGSTVATIIGLLILTLFIFGMDGTVNKLVDFIYKIK
jgi:preprotein translocase subunit SecE